MKDKIQIDWVFANPMKILNLVKRMRRKPATTGELYANDPAYQDFCKEYDDHCRDSGLYRNHRRLISNLVTASFSAQQEGKTPDQLLPELQATMQAVILDRKQHADWLKKRYPEDWEEENPDLTAIPPEVAVERIVTAARSLIRYWELPNYADGLPLLEGCLVKYFQDLKR